MTGIEGKRKILNDETGAGAPTVHVDDQARHCDAVDSQMNLNRLKLTIPDFAFDIKSCTMIGNNMPTIRWTANQVPCGS